MTPPLTLPQTAIMVAMFALGTFLTRVLPFFAFPKSRPTPKFIHYLGQVLPFAITGMLIVYCLRETSFTVSPHGIPELIAVAVTATLFLLFKKSLLAILGGTLLYVFLVQVVFV